MELGCLCTLTAILSYCMMCCSLCVSNHAINREVKVMRRWAEVQVFLEARVRAMRKGDLPPLRLREAVDKAHELVCIPEHAMNDGSPAYKKDEVAQILARNVIALEPGKEMDENGKVNEATCKVLRRRPPGRNQAEIEGVRDWYTSSATRAVAAVATLDDFKVRSSLSDNAMPLFAITDAELAALDERIRVPLLQPLWHMVGAMQYLRQGYPVFILVRVTWLTLFFAGGPVNTPLMYLLRSADAKAFGGLLGIASGSSEETWGEVLITIFTLLELFWMYFQLSTLFRGMRMACYTVQDVSAAFREEMLLGMLTSDHGEVPRTVTRDGTPASGSTYKPPYFTLPTWYNADAETREEMRKLRGKYPSIYATVDAALDSLGPDPTLVRRPSGSPGAPKRHLIAMTRIEMATRLYRRRRAAELVLHLRGTSHIPGQRQLMCGDGTHFIPIGEFSPAVQAFMDGVPVPPTPQGTLAAYPVEERRANHERREAIYRNNAEALSDFINARLPGSAAAREATNAMGNTIGRGSVISAIVFQAARRGSLELERMEAEVRAIAQRHAAPEGFDPLISPLPYLSSVQKDLDRLTKPFVFPNPCADGRDFARDNPLWIVLQNRHVKALSDVRNPSASIYFGHTSHVKMRREVRRHPLSFDAAGLPSPRRPANALLCFVGHGDDDCRDFAARPLLPKEALAHRNSIAAEACVD